MIPLLTYRPRFAQKRKKHKTKKQTNKQNK